MKEVTYFPEESDHSQQRKGLLLFFSLANISHWTLKAIWNIEETQCLVSYLTKYTKYKEKIKAYKKLSDVQMVLRRKQQRQGERHLTLQIQKLFWLFFFLVQKSKLIKKNQTDKPTQNKSNYKPQN